MRPDYKLCVRWDARTKESKRIECSLGSRFSGNRPLSKERVEMGLNLFLRILPIDSSIMSIYKGRKKNSERLSLAWPVEYSDEVSRSDHICLPRSRWSYNWRNGGVQTYHKWLDRGGVRM